MVATRGSYPKVATIAANNQLRQVSLTNMATRDPIRKKIKKDLDQQENEENDQGNNETLIIA